MEPEKQREGFGSRLGFILVSAGCAIGIGNVWRFPTVTGQYGGGIFVLFYLIFLVLMGLPVLTMELAVGRAGHGAARSAYKALEPQGSKWHIHGWFCMVGCILLMMYYTTVSGWMLDYFFRFLTGNFDGLTSVSYTHLTLPTSDLVEFSRGAVSLKKKKKKNINAIQPLPVHCSSIIAT